MLKPPFTVIILKKPQHPLTIRVTYTTVLLMVLPIAVAGIIVGYAIANMSGQKLENGAFTGTSDNSVDFVLSEDTASQDTQAGIIRSLSVRKHGRDELEFIVDFSVESEHELVYVWLIVIPLAGYDGLKEVIPRNPLFKGIPVDYRNGIIMHPKLGETLTIPLTGMMQSGADSEFRVLVYSAEGTVLADRQFKNSSA